MPANIKTSQLRAGSRNAYGFTPVSHSGVGAPVADKRREDRRGEPRVPVRWAVKLAGEAGQMGYWGGWTRNVSAGGALMRVEGRTKLKPGQRVRMGFAGSSGPGVIAADRMVEATVVRRLDHENAQEIAVRFESAKIGMQGSTVTIQQAPDRTIEAA